MNREDFQRLAVGRLEEAEILTNNDCFSGAYYLAGYGIECALKACIAKKTWQYDYPPYPKVVQNIYTHDFEKLVKAAGLEDELKNDRKSNMALDANWNIVEKWSEEFRYRIVDDKNAQAMIDAINNKNNGVLKWISTHW